jgi:MFS family permease
MSSTPEAIPHAPEAAPASPPRVRHPLTVRHFRNLWLGATVSLLGDQFYLVALPWLVLQLTKSTLALGTMLMTAAIPRAVFMLIGGAVIDRFSARRVMMTTAAIRTVLVGGVALLLWLDVVALWHLYLLTFAFGVADAFSFPIMPTLVDPQQLRPANALMQTSAVSSQMIGPAPAGLLIKSWGVPAALFFDALSFLAVIAALFRIPEPAPATAVPAGAPARPGMLQAIAEGLRTVRADPALLGMMTIFATINLCVSGPIAVGLAAVAKFRFGSAAAFGTLLSFFGLGMLTGLFLGGFVRRPRKRGLQFILMSGLCGVELIAIGLSTKLAAIAALLAVMGLGVGFVNVQFSSWVQLRVDRTVLGRVMSVLMFSAVGLAPISYAISGVVAKWSLPALFLGAGALLLGISALGVTGRAAREID